MDKNSVTGLALIAVIMLVWLQFMTPTKKVQPPLKTATTEQHGATASSVPTVTPLQSTDTFGLFAPFSQGNEQVTVVENDVFRATLSSKGATLKSLVLKKHLDGHRNQFDLLGKQKNGHLSLLFLTKDGKRIDTRELYFQPIAFETQHTVTGKERYVVRYRLDVAPAKSIEIAYLFSGESYAVDYDVKLVGFGDDIAGNEYQVQWDGGLAYTEKNREEESQNALTAAYLGGSLVKLDAAKEKEVFREEQSGEATWVGVRNKYFTAALIPHSKSNGIYLEGKREGGNHFENYLAALKMSLPASVQEVHNTYTMYIGPLDYNTVKAQGVELEKIMDFGWDWLTRPFAEWLILPVFNWMNSFISNYGLIIIIFAFLIKLVTYPLSMASTKSMKKMAALQPVLQELQVKYKDNPQKLQSELTRIYREAGVNPVGGCLPTLLQMPLLFAMFYVFRSSIQLRQHGFLWADDLSVPDSILNFGFAIPLYGDHIALFPILMAVTVYVQQKITPTAQPNDQMKVMLVLFPVMMLFFFNNMPAGLGLYYLMFNIFSVAQQFYINKTTTADDMPKVNLAPASTASSKKQKKGGAKK